MIFPKCPVCGNVITNDDCGISVDSNGFTDCCWVHYITGEPKISEEEGE